MEKTKFHLLVLLIISVFSLSLIVSCIPDLADIEPPLVDIVYPADGTSVNGTVQIVVSASDDNKVKEVQIFIDGIRVVTSEKNFVSYSWETTAIADNLEHYISAIALDESDNIGNTPVIAVTVIQGDNNDNTDPEVEILNPVGGQILTGDVNIVAEASDNNEVAKVEFYIDGLLEQTVLARPFDYLWETTRADTGEHTIFARAYDTNANTAASTTITVTVDTILDNTAPVVNILNPIGGQVVSGNVNIVANATDNNQINRVEFYIDGFLEETVTNSPFDYLWNTTLTNDGLHTIFVRAYDPNNNMGVSSTITVTVTNSVNNKLPEVNNLNSVDDQVAIVKEITPKVKIISPSRSGLIFSKTETKSISIEAKIPRYIGVDKVEFYIDGQLQEVVKTENVGHYKHDWNIENYGDGLLHTIFVKVFDESLKSNADMIVVRVYP